MARGRSWVRGSNKTKAHVAFEVGGTQLSSALQVWGPPWRRTTCAPRRRAGPPSGHPRAAAMGGCMLTIKLALLIPLMLAAYSVLCLVGLGLIVLGIGYLADESMVSAGPTM